MLLFRIDYDNLDIDEDDDVPRANSAVKHPQQSSENSFQHPKPQRSRSQERDHLNRDFARREDSWRHQQSEREIWKYSNRDLSWGQYSQRGGHGEGERRPQNRGPSCGGGSWQKRQSYKNGWSRQNGRGYNNRSDRNYNSDGNSFSYNSVGDVRHRQYQPDLGGNQYNSYQRRRGGWGCEEQSFSPQVYGHQHHYPNRRGRAEIQETNG